jgi:hypothetical protein
MSLRTKFSYNSIPQHREPLEVQQYILHRTRATNQIARTFGILKSLHTVISESSQQARKNPKNAYKSEGKQHLSEYLVTVLQGFVQKQHIYAK